MKPSTPSMIAITLTLFLSACSATGQSPGQVAANMLNRENITPTTNQRYTPKSPQTVAIFTKKQAPGVAYRIIGVAKVSKYNLLGMHRPENTVHKMMRSLAASIGGDGLIDVSNTNDDIQAKVIAFQKIMI